MSRYLNIPLKILPGVDLKFEEASLKVQVKGPKGTLEFSYPSVVVFHKDGDQIKIALRPDFKGSTSFVGLSFKILENMMIGVTRGFKKTLEFVGVGYRMAVKGNVLNMQLGYSHDVNFDIPKGIVVEVKAQVVSVEGIDKEEVGRVADKIKSFRPVEPYKGKGIKYQGQHVIRKAGKSGKSK